MNASCRNTEWEKARGLLMTSSTKSARLGYHLPSPVADLNLVKLARAWSIKLRLRLLWPGLAPLGVPRRGIVKGNAAGFDGRCSRIWQDHSCTICSVSAIFILHRYIPCRSSFDKRGGVDPWFQSLFCNVKHEQ